MTGKQRALAAFRGAPADRTPVIPIVGQAAARFCGVPIARHAGDPAILVDCQVECARRFGYDGIYIAADTWVNAQAVGFPGIDQPEDEPAGGCGSWIEDLAHIETLPIPDPDRHGRWPRMVEAVRRAVAQVGDELLVIANFDQSPFSLACQLRGINRFMIDLIENPTLAHRLLSYAAQAVSRYAIALGQAGAHVLNTGDSAAGGSLIGGAWYTEFALPYERQVVQAIRTAGIDVPVSLHICGDANVCLEHMTGSGADGFELDAGMDLAEARRRVGPDVTLIGNLGPVDPLLRGTPDEVCRAARRCLDTMKGDGRFIFSTGCAVSPLTPPAHLEAMVKAAVM